MIIHRLGVDQEFIARLIPVFEAAVGHGQVKGLVQRIAFRPGDAHDHRNRRHGLIVKRSGISDDQLVAVDDKGAAWVRDNLVAVRAIYSAGSRQGCHRQVADCGFANLARRKLDIHRCAGIGLKHLRLDGRAVAVLRHIIRVPRHHEATVRQRGDRGSFLRIRRLGIDQKFAALGGAGGIEHLRLDAISTIILNEVNAVPRHHKTAARQRGDLGLVLIIPRF